MEILAGKNSYAGQEGKYLTFRLGDEEYGLGIMKIREIIGFMPITSVPQTPAFVKGVINLRGKVIPVVDLRLRFSMPKIPHDAKTCIIILDISRDCASLLIGVVVDSVSEVLNIRDEDIEETPVFGVRFNTEYILGMAKTGDGVKILLDIDKVLTESEVGAISGL